MNSNKRILIAVVILLVIVGVVLATGLGTLAMWLHPSWSYEVGTVFVCSARWFGALPFGIDGKHVVCTGCLS